MAGAVRGLLQTPKAGEAGGREAKNKSRYFFPHKEATQRRTSLASFIHIGITYKDEAAPIQRCFELVSCLV